MKLEEPNVDCILIDPGKFYLSLVADLSKKGFSPSEILPVTAIVLSILNQSTCLDDRKPLGEFIQSLVSYAEKEQNY